jgi:c-di-GMP-binding flagellar brake protein YcgR
MMQNPKQIKNIQVFDKNERLILDFSKNFFFPAKQYGDKVVDDVLTLRGKKLPEFAPADTVDVIINTKSGERIKYYCYVGFSDKKRLDLRLNVGQARQLEDKRRFYKIKAEINCRVTDAIRGEESVTFQPNLYGRIQDINIGGVFISVDANVHFEKSDIITISAVLGTQKLNAIAQILRIQTDQTGEITGYGCAFVDIKSHQEEIISSYITRVQIEERQLERKKELQG